MIFVPHMCVKASAAFTAAAAATSDRLISTFYAINQCEQQKTGGEQTEVWSYNYSRKVQNLHHFVVFVNKHVQECPRSV